MKRSIKKFLTTILAIIIIVGILLNVYNSFNIDPRIWFLIIYGTVILLIFCIYSIYEKELEKFKNYIKTHTFDQFYEEYLEKYEKHLEKYVDKLEIIFKRMKNFYNCKIYKLLDSICRACVITAICYKLFFEEDFYSRIAICIVYLIMLFFITINSVINVVTTLKRIYLAVAIIYVTTILLEVNYMALLYL